MPFKSASTPIREPVRLRPMMAAREAWEKLCDHCSRRFPCLCDPGRRSSWGLKAALVLLHVVFVGVLFLLDADLIQKTKEESWYTILYLGLFAATLVQYFFTSGSSPGYVIDAMRSEYETTASFTSSLLIPKQSTSRNGNLIPSTDRSHFGKYPSEWLKIVMDLYPPGSSSRNWTCTYCNIIQPPRTKHCHDCDNVYFQFDHRCLWLGHVLDIRESAADDRNVQTVNCYAASVHSTMWYIFEESILCIWTGILYISFLHSRTEKAWWQDCIAILLLALLILCLIFLLLLLFFHTYLVLTNQTTYELVRRRRILYLRGVPERVHPFSKGICRNLYNFCCSRDSLYALESVPRSEELQARARPYTCSDLMSCRCL
ncbi:protein S-acyltransferase 10 [Dioscorea cayenensis subsp. rotundata]|uniref:S-acyltransferase n=1 Tax=Dioscorea cayennensis subsp. rotundata TaxID=55577 RepID=A0AB40AZZ3_DIOCR|nr:protein S-acyltransferase 10 [Dioscorea cayenensis subsp. rotundata]